MMASEVIAEAKWLAREHVAATDPFSTEQWLASLVAVWPRLWVVHPEAFHIDGVLVGSPAAAPALVGDTVAIGGEWLGTLAAGVAARALGAMRPSSPEHAETLAADVARLDGLFVQGLG